MSEKLTVEDALKELREMFERGNTIGIAVTIQVGFRSWSAPTLDEAMAQVRAWHKEQSK